MKIHPILPAVFSSILLLNGCISKTESKISIDWIIDSEMQADKNFNNTIRIINNGNIALDTAWTIYFCAFPKKYNMGETSPVTIERISGTYYKMNPSERFVPLNRSDTLTIDWHTPSNHATISFAPHQAYIVQHIDGKEQPPVSVDVRIIRKDPVNTPNAAENSIRFNENAKYLNPVQLEPFDILPTIKSATPISGNPVIFDRDVHIISDDVFENEVRLLSEQLRTFAGCTLSDSGKNIIRLVQRDDFVPINKEHYLIEIKDNEISIAAPTPHAAFNGIQTLLSIFSNRKFPFTLPATSIADYPDMGYRGFMLDVSRNFTTKENLLRLIDLLASYKMNVLHLHISDDEGWRVEIPGLEELSEVGSRRGHTSDESNCLQPSYLGYWNALDTHAPGNGFYSRADFVDIITYAAQRHICIIPEIDLPGHARAAIVAMKARYNKYKAIDMQKATEYLLSEPSDTSRYTSVQGYDDNVVNVALPSTYRFVNKVIGELASMYREAGQTLRIMHIGGDEVPTGAWTGSPSCRQLMAELKTEHARDLKDYFVEQIVHAVKSQGIQLAGWQEIVLKPHSSTVDKRFANENVLSYCWNTMPYNGGDEVPYKLANHGFDVILSNASNFYMDFAYTDNFYEPGHNWGGYVDDRNSFDAQPYNLYNSVRTNEKDKSPSNDRNRSKEKLEIAGTPHIVGMQGQLWTETVHNFDMVNYYMFPKMFGLAERCWNSEPLWTKSGSETAYSEAISKYNAVNCLHELPRLRQRGINFRISEPAVTIIDGQLHINCRTIGSTLRYTTDGSEPTVDSKAWTQPEACQASLIKAKAFCLGKESVTTIFVQE